MKQREVTDNKGTTWTCVQAYSGPGSEGMEKEIREAGEENGQVTVVCTPRGGEQTVHLSLAPGWLEETSDQELLQKIG